MAKIKSPWGIITTQLLSGDIWRVVESQEQIATLGIVSNLEEQHLLEQMLDDTKAILPEETNKLDYLLFTPFRYPPLKWGSRFGKESERGIFYGSKKLETALAEVAYYRLLFWDGMSIAPEAAIVTQHTGFQAGYKITQGVDLTQAPFDSDEYAKLLQSKTDYSFTQEVGSFCRENKIGGISFTSVRCPQQGTNIALLEPSTLSEQSPFNKNEVVCELNKDDISFTVMHGKQSVYRHFSRGIFI